MAENESAKQNPGRGPGTDAWGIDARYKDTKDQWRTISPATRAALMKAMGAEGKEKPDSGEGRVKVIRAGEKMPLKSPAELALEDGTVVRVEKALPPDLPPGYHELRLLREKRSLSLIVSPGKCYLPEGLRIWGWAVQLYALRSKRSWGIGDLGDLKRLAEWSRENLDAGILMVNPLSAASPLAEQNPSPYYPSSRRFLNPIYLRIEEVPGARGEASAIAKWSEAGRGLNQNRRIDRAKIFPLKMKALERLWRTFEGGREFERFCEREGEPLKQFATFCALCETHQSGWNQWPREYWNPSSSGVARFAAENENRILFHQWLQWLMDRQLAKVSESVPVMQDLPIGVDPGGADAWAFQDVLARNVAVGAPPDSFNTKGQNWGLPPFIPHKLRTARYEPFRQTIRAALRHAGGLRIDHVMGLFRLFWIPAGSDPKEGAYVRYPAEDLLAITALESWRAKAVVVGEDLGTVEEGMRERMAACAMLSYRVLWFEERRPSTYPKQALAAVTTHDLPSIAGLWMGTDLQAQRDLGMQPNEEGTRKMRQRLEKMAGLSGECAVREAILGTHKLLAEAPSRIVTATLDDALAVEERPNMPGTTDEWPNWSLALPMPLEQIEKDPFAKQIGKALQRGHAVNRLGSRRSGS
jgi:4-alpha-glucanotransferase